MPAAKHSIPSIAELFGAVRVIPVLTVRDADHAVPVARALAGGGLPILEITLRTEAALESIRRIAQDVPEAVVGAGTVTDLDEFAAARDAGARFAVSPGLDEAIVNTAAAAGLPCLPGVATATEMMQAQGLGLTHLKFFPASAAGGPAALRAFAGPFPRLRFCPTGGVDGGTLRDYLSLPNVFAAGGSWVAPSHAMAAGDWSRIAMLARQAAAESR